MASGDAKAEQESSIESNSDSSDSNSDFSSEDGSSDVSDLDKFEEAYEEFGRLTEGVDVLALDRNLAGNKSDDVPGLSLAGSLDTLHTLANVPKTWPLARLTIPLSGFSKQLERLLEGYCMEIYATNAQPDAQLMSIKLFAKDLVLVLAFHLAERIASLLRQVLDHSTKVLYDPENEVLFLQGAQPQRLTVSLLLPGGGTADQWLDFLQSQRQFWPAMTTRHASLAPISAQTFQRERRHMQSKHLWDTIKIDWQQLSWVLSLGASLCH